MNVLKSKLFYIYYLFSLSFLFNYACKRDPWGKKESDSYAQIFIDVHDLGRRITLHSSFNEFLGHIPDFKWESRVYLARIDDLPIGNRIWRS